MASPVIIERAVYHPCGLAVSLQPGTSIGPYRIEAAIAAGGMGEVYRARDTRLGRDVALKVLPADVARDPGRLARFAQEARTVSALNHPNIITIYDVGIETDQPYVVFELLRGMSLRDALADHRISTARALGYAAQIAEGIGAAHEHGIVHRDLKPENVMIVSSKPADRQPAEADELKIMDFGLAKVLDTGTGVTESVTVAGQAMGTLGYMAPEVLTGGMVDERADLFAIGVMVVETLTGARPFRGSTQQEIFLALLQNEFHLPGQSTEIRALDVILQRCLAKDVRDRYGAAAELAKDLVPALARCRGLGAPHDLTMSDSPTVGERDGL